MSKATKVSTITPEEQEWMDSKHNPAWRPGPNGGRIIRPRTRKEK